MLEVTEKKRKNSFGVASIQGKIRTEDLPNTSLQNYSYLVDMINQCSVSILEYPRIQLRGILQMSLNGKIILITWKLKSETIFLLFLNCRKNVTFPYLEKLKSSFIFDLKFPNSGHI
jgi:hypothetical protein